MSSNSHYGRLLQAANMARILKVARLLRVIRVLRTARFGGYHAYWQQQQFLRKQRKAERGLYQHAQQQQQQQEQQPEPESHSNRVGLQLSELIDKRVLIMMLGLLIAMVLLTSDNSTTLATSSMTVGLAMLNGGSGSSSSSSLQPQTVKTIIDNYIAYQSDTLLFLQYSGTVYINLLPDYNHLRSCEQQHYNSNGDGNPATAVASAVFNIRDIHYQQAYYNISVTAFIVLLFLLGSILVVQNVYTFVSTETQLLLLLLPLWQVLINISPPFFAFCCRLLPPSCA